MPTSHTASPWASSGRPSRISPECRRGRATPLAPPFPLGSFHGTGVHTRQFRVGSPHFAAHLYRRVCAGDGSGGPVHTLVPVSDSSTRFGRSPQRWAPVKPDGYAHVGPIVVLVGRSTGTVGRRMPADQLAVLVPGSIATATEAHELPLHHSREIIFRGEGSLNRCSACYSTTATTSAEVSFHNQCVDGNRVTITVI